MVGALLDVLMINPRDQEGVIDGDQTGSIRWNWRQDVCPSASYRRGKW